ncbi:ATP-binding protein [Rhabdothermincola salaria]|uniref:ATP-binding protein n=1 Tax=Rhabdothermincola salaria TaxID=2903142 RepID=UPI001E467836|nr:ATP-binding protein [Rhabdothermincola salaria]
MGEIRLEIPARAEYLALARQVVAAAAAVEPRFRTERIDALRLAVSEATTNAVESHADLGADERIVIRCDLDEERIEVEVLDQGGGFDPGGVPVVPSPTDPSRLDYEHGLGIPIIRELTDESEIRPSGAGTAVRLVVYRSAAAAARRGSEAVRAEPEER